MIKKKLSEGAQLSARTRTRTARLTLFIFSSNSVPAPWSGVVWLSELARYAQSLHRACSHNVSTNTPVTGSESRWLDRRCLKADH